MSNRAILNLDVYRYGNRKKNGFPPILSDFMHLETTVSTLECSDAE
jgi:hypothetical protein